MFFVSQRKKNIMKRIVLLTLITVVLLGWSTVFADGPLDWQATGKAGKEIVDQTEKQIAEVGVSIHVIIQAVLYIVAFLALMIHGAKHFFSGSNSNKKSELKDEQFNMLKGSAILFGAGFIYTLLYTLFSQFGK
ncbi:MAG: hypothetical protein AB7G87_04980 [Clostridia bacterium]